MKRRKFIKTAAISGAAMAGGSGIFFPKPANSYTINYVLSLDGRSDAVFGTMAQANVAREASESLPPETDQAVINVVQEVQTSLQERNFTDNQTPFSRRLGNVNQPLWGQQRNEGLGPNPGFGTTQIKRNFVTPISFTGSTTAGIDRAMLILGNDENLNAQELDSALIPTESLFEDWGTWAGDLNPQTGEIISTNSVATYETKYGIVTRLYTADEPVPGGRGTITFNIDGGRNLQTRITVEVEFA